MKPVKKKCDKCGKLRNSLTQIKGKFYCGICKHGALTKLPSNGRFSEQQILNSLKNKRVVNGGKTGIICVHHSLVGRKVEVVLK